MLVWKNCWQPGGSETWSTLTAEKRRDKPRSRRPGGRNGAPSTWVWHCLRDGIRSQAGKRELLATKAPREGSRTLRPSEIPSPRFTAVQRPRREKTPTEKRGREYVNPLPANSVLETALLTLPPSSSIEPSLHSDA